jgi:hypothetical protein
MHVSNRFRAGLEEVTSPQGRRDVGAERFERRALLVSFVRARGQMS